MGQREVPAAAVIAVVAALVLVIGFFLWRAAAPPGNSFNQLSKDEQLKRVRADAKNLPHRNVDVGAAGGQSGQQTPQ
jgi:hypothetical protein